jgi:hypothetical protein
LALLGFPQRGGDKAPVPSKAEAKAGRYAPFFKNVDESGTRLLGSLTGFRPKPGDAGAFSAKMPNKILGEPEPYRDFDRPIRTRGDVFEPRLKR